MTAVEFSIVIPTYRRTPQLIVCLTAISKLDYPRDSFEVIVVDDGGGDVRPAVAALSNSLNLTVIEQPNSGPAAARNNGAARATKPYLAFLDDDCEPAPGWLAALAAQFAVTADCMAGGLTVNRLEDNPYAVASQSLVDYLYDYYGAQQATFFTSNNMAMLAARFHQMGGFDTTFRTAAGEDREFCWQWRNRGWPMGYCPDAVIAHSHRMNWRGFWRQHFNYGRAAFQFHQARAEIGQTVRVEPLTFYWHLLFYPFEKPLPKARLRATILLFISQLANALGFFTRYTAGR